VPEVTTRGARIACAVSAATGPDLLLIHSLGTTRALFAAQRERLAAHCRILEYDLRGHGDSDAPGGDYTLAELAADARAVLDAAGSARAHVLGLSLGGAIALELAVRTPERVDRLIVANSAARIGSADLWSQRAAEVRARGVEHLPEQVLPRWLSEPFRRANPALVDQLHTLLLRTPAAGYAGCCAALRDADLRDAVAGIRTPALVISGDQDTATPLSQGEWLAKQISGARHVALAAAHLSCVEQPDAFSSAVLDFLDR